PDHDGGPLPVLVRKPPRGRVGEDLVLDAGVELLLLLLPEFRREEVAMLRDEGIAVSRAGEDESWELLGKDIARPHEVPRLARHLFLVAFGSREMPKGARFQRRNLVVVVEHHPSEARHAEVLREQVAGKHTGPRKLANRLAVFEERLF